MALKVYLVSFFIVKLCGPISSNIRATLHNTLITSILRIRMAR